MNKARTRVILTFIFLALVQIACGCDVDHDVAVHVYQDLNGNSTQDSDEPDFPGIEVSSDKDQNYLKTNNNGDVTVGSQPENDCSDYWPRMFIPSGYTRTENDRSPASWDFSSVLFSTSQCPNIFAYEKQKGDWTIGLQPIFEMTKTAEPTTFSASGETITYTYVISNTTANDFTQVSVTDDKTTVSCPAATVAAGASLTCTATYVTSGEDVSRGSITITTQFTATVRLRDNLNYGYNLDLTSAPVTATVTLEEQAPVGGRSAPTTLLDPAPVFTSAVLTGEVFTLCDTVNRPVNLKLVAGTDNALVTQELANGNLQVLIGGTDISSTCQVSPLNTVILTCTYPADLTSLPAEGQVLYKTAILQTFRFDGESNCTPPPKDNSSGGDSTGDQPAACDPHTNDSCPLDCNDPANADLCG